IRSHCNSSRARLFNRKEEGWHRVSGFVFAHPEIRSEANFFRTLTLSASLTLVAAIFTCAQEPPNPNPTPKPTQAPSGMGVATGAAHPAVKDSHSRPITAGGFVDGAPIVFADITKTAGLDKFVHRSGSPKKTTILETMGSGV